MTDNPGWVDGWHEHEGLLCPASPEADAFGGCVCNAVAGWLAGSPALMMEMTKLLSSCRCSASTTGCTTSAAEPGFKGQPAGIARTLPALHTQTKQATASRITEACLHLTDSWWSPPRPRAGTHLMKRILSTRISSRLKSASLLAGSSLGRPRMQAPRSLRASCAT